jgi:hypothetical protein
MVSKHNEEEEEEELKLNSWQSKVERTGSTRRLRRRSE